MKEINTGNAPQVHLFDTEAKNPRAGTMSIKTKKSYWDDPYLLPQTLHKEYKELAQ